LYRVRIERRARKEIEQLPTRDGDRVARSIKQLAGEPRPPGCVRLSGTSRSLLRVRVGPYRIIYEIRDEALLVLVVSVAKRDEVYRGL
jgi:mRNA interferase RelE/StbE